MTFIYEEQTIKIADLNLTHPLIDALHINLDSYYSNMAKHFGYSNHLNLPAIDENLNVLTNKKDVLFMKSEGHIECKVVMVKGLGEIDTMKLILAQASDRRVSYSSKYKILCYLENFLKTTAQGKQWQEELGHGKMKDILAEITGMSPTTVFNIYRIGKKNNSSLQLLDTGETSLREELKKTKELENPKKKTEKKDTGSEISSSMKDFSMQFDAGNGKSASIIKGDAESYIFSFMGKEVKIHSFKATSKGNRECFSLLTEKGECVVEISFKTLG